jgi:RHS repeat-associated protein
VTRFVILSFALNTLIHTYTYTYDSTWKDKLTSYDGNSITTDAIGNTTGYNGWTYTWEAGRQLQQMSDGSTTLQFKYNDAGLRTQKINGSTTTTYYWNGNAITHITSGSDTLHFYYDDDMLAMMNINGTDYYPVYNLQGDVIKLINKSDGSLVATYIYDSWGKLLSIKDSAGNDRTTDETFIGYKNPIRYRGYLYDSETGLYYLLSRYYSPDWSRFINADLYSELLQIEHNAYTNLYIYCANNPMLNVDPMGTHYWKRYSLSSAKALVTIFRKRGDALGSLNFFQSIYYTLFTFIPGIGAAAAVSSAGYGIGSGFGLGQASTSCYTTATKIETMLENDNGHHKYIYVKYWEWSWAQFNPPIPIDAMWYHGNVE